MKGDTFALRRVPAPVEAPWPWLLAPADPASAEAFAKVPADEDVPVKLARGRSLPQHRTFWAVLSYVAEASEWETPERLLVAIKIRLGRYDLMRLPNGKTVPVPQSISFSAMPQDEFQRFFDEAMRVICDEVLPGHNPDDLIVEATSAKGVKGSPAATVLDAAPDERSKHDIAPHGGQAAADGEVHEASE